MGMFDITKDELSPAIITLKRLKANMEEASEHAPAHDHRSIWNTQRKAIGSIIGLMESMHKILERYEGANIMLFEGVCYNCKEVLHPTLLVTPLVGIVNGNPIPLCRKCYPDFVREDI